MILFGDHHRFGQRLLRRSLELAGIWLILTGAATSALLPGLLVVLPAALASLLLPPVPAWSWLPLGLCRFLPFFLFRSLLAGIDVARRAFSPHPRLNPGLITYAWRLPPGPARIFLANTVSLLPGTLSVGLEADQLIVHTLDDNPKLEQELSQLETMVGQLFKMAGGRS